MRFGALVRGRIWVGAVALLTACTLDNRGLRAPAASPSGTGGGSTDSGGANTTGGSSASGGDGAGGLLGGSGGIPGNGDLTGGATGVAGISGSGGPGTGGDGMGAGGVAASGGDIGAGGHAATGGESGCASCAPCYRCGADGLCELNPTSPWKLSCVSASIASTNTNGDPWDPGTDSGNGAAPDPFCEFQIHEIGQKDTMTLTDTFAPEWNEDITPMNVKFTPTWVMAQAGSWSILVADYDGMTSDSICEVYPPLTAANFASEKIVFSNVQSCKKLTLRLTCNE